MFPSKYLFVNPPNASTVFLLMVSNPPATVPFLGASARKESPADVLKFLIYPSPSPIPQSIHLHQNSAAHTSQ